MKPGCPEDLLRLQNNRFTFDWKNAEQKVPDKINWHKPVHMPGMVRRWPAYQKWQKLSYFRKKCDMSLDVDVACSRSGIYSGNIHLQESHTMSLSTFLDYCECASRNESHPLSNTGYQYYLAQCPIMLPSNSLQSALLHQLQDDILLEFTGGVLSQINLWMGAFASHSTLHFDSYHNFLCVLKGSKTVTMFSPLDTPDLYACPVFGPNVHHSDVSTSAPDLTM
jgi:hypothetical protein